MASTKCQWLSRPRTFLLRMLANSWGSRDGTFYTFFVIFFFFTLKKHSTSRAAGSSESIAKCLSAWEHLCSTSSKKTSQWCCYTPRSDHIRLLVRLREGQGSSLRTSILKISGLGLVQPFNGLCCSVLRGARPARLALRTHQTQKPDVPHDLSSSG